MPISGRLTAPMGALLCCQRSTRRISSGAFHEHLLRCEAALQTAGFHSVTALSVDDGWTKINFFDISAVVIDHEFADDPRAKEFGEHYVTLRLDLDALPEQVALELVEQFGRGSELVQ